MSSTFGRLFRVTIVLPDPQGSTIVPKPVPGLPSDMNASAACTW